MDEQNSFERGDDGDSGRWEGELARARAALEPVKASLAAAGFYAYGMIDEQHRWTVAADSEEGRVDVRVGADGLNVSLWTSSPGLYADEENDFRRRALERLARMTLPNIVRGFLAPHQSAVWDETDQGIAVTISYDLPFVRAGDVGELVRDKLVELEELLTFVESRVST